MAADSNEDVFNLFTQWKEKVAIPVAAIKALTSLIEKSQCSTMMGLEIELRAAADELNKKAQDAGYGSLCSLAAGCELFLRYVTRTYEELEVSMRDFSHIKAVLVETGKDFAELSMRSREKIALLARNFIIEGSTVLLHGYSRVVMCLLIDAASHRKNFNVVVTEGRPGEAGEKVRKRLESEGIPVRLIHDSAVGFIMEQVNLVLVGAEGVVENGGIVNKMGTYQLAVIAKESKIPFYVASESYKFTRMFPINQAEIRSLEGTNLDGDNTFANPQSDFTPPEYITLLFTDLGVLTPSAVSDELIKLYQ